MEPAEVTQQLAQLMITRSAAAIELLDSLPEGTIAEGIGELIRCRHGLMTAQIRAAEVEQRLAKLKLPTEWLIRRDLVRVTAAHIIRDFDLAERLLLPILDRLTTFPADIVGPAAVLAGRVYAAKGDLKSALTWYYSGLGMIGDQLPGIRASILNNIACEHAGAGSNTVAAELFQRALDIYTRERVWPKALMAAANLSDIMIEDGRAAEAVTFLLGWERAHPEVFHLPEANFFLGLLSMAHIRSGNVEESKERLASIKVNKTDMDQRILITLVSAYIAIAEERHTDALDLLLALRAETHHERGLMAILEPLSDVYAAIGNFRLAYDCAVERREILARIKKTIRDISNIEVEVRRQVRVK